MENKKELSTAKVKLEKDFSFMRNGCWREDYKAGEVELDAESLRQAKSLGLVKKTKE